MAITYSEDGGIVKFAATADELPGWLDVLFLYWYAKSASAGSDAAVTDSLDNEIWTTVADAANFTQIFPVKRKVYGLKIATLDTGYIIAVLDKKQSKGKTT